MRVLHVHSGNLFGGVETMMLAMARHRDLCPEMDTAFALCFKGRLERELSGFGAEIHEINEVKIRQLDSVWRARRRLAALLRERRFDAALTHSAWTHTIFAPVIRAAGAPLISFLHEPTGGNHWLERWARRTPPDLVICNSRFTASSVTNIYPGVPSAVLYPMISPVKAHTADYTRGERARVRAELDTDENAVLIVQVSRMESWKGHKLHLRALGKLHPLSNWMCWVVGGAQRPQEARYLAELKELAAELGIAARVRFLGERSDVPSLMAAADIHCQPNTGPEPFGLTFIEALLAGLPVVSVEHGGVCEIVDDSCGVLTPPGDEDSLAAALNQLIDDPGLRLRLGAAGPERARQLCDAGGQLERLRNLCSAITQCKAA